jgi:hypothetical protein
LQLTERNEEQVHQEQKEVKHMYADTDRRSSNRANSKTRSAGITGGNAILRSGGRAQDGGLRTRPAVTVAKSTGTEPQRYFEDLRKTVAPLRETLLKHPIYTDVDSLDRLREFMQIHVFAVWDFMSLVKRLQSEVTCDQLPWLPPARRQVARFANEVVLGEESDLGPDGKPSSHFELYLRAMDEVGAETAEVRTFITRIDQGESWETALKELKVPGGITDFVSETLRCAIHGSVVGVAAYFFFGREDVIPEMFKKLLALWGEGAVEVPHFAFYLERHIELDGESHGPWAQEMLMALAGQDEKRWMEATHAARRAITSRIRLWDSVVAHLRNSA